MGNRGYSQALPFRRRLQRRRPAAAVGVAEAGAGLHRRRAREQVLARRAERAVAQDRHPLREPAAADAEQVVEVVAVVLLRHYRHLHHLYPLWTSSWRE